MAPLLRIVDMKRTAEHNRLHKILNPPLYVPLQKKNFDIIEINIMTDTGNPVPLYAENPLRCWSLNASGCSRKLYEGRHLQFSSFAIMKRKAAGQRSVATRVAICTKITTPIRADTECQFSSERDISADTDSAVYSVDCLGA